MRTFRVLILVVVSLIAANARSDDTARKEMEKLHGTWTLISAERDGKQAPREEMKRIRFVFSEDRMIAEQGDRKNEMTCKLDPSTSPKAIDISYIDGGRKGQVDRGIYALEGDALKICLSRGGERPTEFATHADSNRHLMVLKRAKP